MNHQLNYMLALQHIADLQRSADRARLASEVDARRRDSHSLSLRDVDDNIERWRARQLSGDC